MKTSMALALAASLISSPVVAATPSDPAKPPSPARACFWTREANNFASTDDRVVNVRVGLHDVYQFEMFGACPDMDWSNRIALVSRGSSQICTGMDAEIVTHSQIGPQRCAVRSTRKLTPEEIAALPKRARP